MFTGCIKNLGKLALREKKEAKWNIAIQSLLANTVNNGESIAVNGVCLTIKKKQIHEKLIYFEVLDETMNKTNLEEIEIGSFVNLEQALSVGDRLDGHLVTGHVDCTAPILYAGTQDKDFILNVEIPIGYQKFIIEKGSITVDGVSLTVAKVTDETFTIHLVSYTREHTNLGKLPAEYRVNLEMDLIGKYVIHNMTISKN